MEWKSTKLQGTDEFGSGDQSEELWPIQGGIRHCRLGRSKWHEQGAGTGRHAQGRLRFELGRHPEEMESRRPSVRGLGDLSPQRLAGRTRQVVRIPIQRLVRPGDAAL